MPTGRTAGAGRWRMRTPTGGPVLQAPVVTWMSTRDIVSQKAPATSESSTSSLVSRVNKKAYFFPLWFFSSQKPAQFFNIFIHEAGRSLQKAAEYVYKPTCLTRFSMTDGINQSKIPKQEKQGGLTAPKYTRGNITQCRNRPEWLQHFCICIWRRLGYSFSLFPQVAVPTRLKGVMSKNKVTHGRMTFPIEIPTMGKAENSIQTLDYKISVAVISVQVRNQLS